jgi:hypothetical protein
LLASAFVQSSSAMPGTAHDSVAAVLLSHGPPHGAKGLTMQHVKSINRWMDNPATKTGQYVNRRAGAIIHPRNHGLLRHNPDAVARALSGTGKANAAIKNIARIHKIADVAHNVAPVDGWLISPRVRAEAQGLVVKIARTSRLPNRLPTWVDQPGPLIRLRSPTAVTRMAKAMPLLAIVVEGTIRASDAYGTEKMYRSGEITAVERGSRHSENVGGMTGGVGGAAVGAMCGAAVGSWFGGVGAIPGSAIGAAIGGVGGGIAGDRLGSKAGRAIYDRMH